MNKIVFCLPISDNQNENLDETVEYNSIDTYSGYESTPGTSTVPIETVWHGKDNIVSNDSIYERKVSNTMIQYSYENVHKQWPSSTSYHCYHCCHPFDNRPHFIPINYDKQNEIFHVYGNFCSFNCALSFNNDTRKGNWTKNAELLHFLYRTIHGVDTEIKMAPSKETLVNFGGNITIDEFRGNFANDTFYDIIYPPIVSMISQITESIKLKSVSDTTEIKYKPIQKQLFKKPKKMVQKKLFSKG